MLNKTIDVLAFVKGASESRRIVSKNQAGKEFDKRDLIVVDDSGCEVTLTLWGDKASTDYGWASQPIVAFKGVKVGDFGGRSLSLAQGGSFLINPVTAEAHELYQWFQGQGGIQNFASTSLSASGTRTEGSFDPLEKRKTMTNIKDEGMGRGEKPDWFTVKGYIAFLKHDSDPWYTACSQGTCKKKVTEIMGHWRCEACNVELESCQYRYVLSAQLSDHTGAQWFSFFDDTASKLLGMSANDLHMLKEEHGENGEFRGAFAVILIPLFYFHMAL